MDKKKPKAYVHCKLVGDMLILSTPFTIFYIKSFLKSQLAGGSNVAKLKEKVS